MSRQTNPKSMEYIDHWFQSIKQLQQLIIQGCSQSFFLMAADICAGPSAALIFIMNHQQFLFEPTTTIRQDLSTYPYVRHYMQEESFTCNTGQQLKVELPYNHLINQILSELSILNKTIATNSKLTTSLLQNGRDIFLKKRQHLDQFRNEYPIIRDALDCMPPHFRFVFEYSLMALSNLILKLSINMAKISIIVTTKFLTPSYLNLFTAALLFEKYLELQLVKNKKFASYEEQRQFLKQFPKITVVKVSKRRNPYDLELIQRCQAAFNQNYSANRNTAKSQPDVCNIQLLEFFEYEDEALQLTRKKTLRKYPLYESFNLSQEFDMKVPFGFELHLLMSEIAVPKMLEFKPDIIVFIQDFDSDCASIDPKVRGLIVNEFSEKVQHKIYVLKEFGITEEMKLLWLRENNQPDLPEFSTEFCNKVQKCLDCMEPTFYTEYNSFIYACDKLQDRKTSIGNYMRQNMQITADLFKQLQDYLKVQYRRDTIFASKTIKESDVLLGQRLKKMHGNMLEDLTYLSLALIQKSNFDGTRTEFRNYNFPPQFLDKAIAWMNKELIITEDEKGFSEAAEHYKSRIEKLKGMKFLSVAAAQDSLSEPISFYNFLSKKIENLQVKIGEAFRPIYIGKDDSFYLAYVDNYVILFVFSEFYNDIYRKTKNQEHFQRVKRINHSGDLLYLCKHYSTFIANGRYLYKAFGESKCEDLNKESEIWRFCIEAPSKLQEIIWEKVDSNCIPISSVVQKNPPKKVPKIPIQFKKFGYGFSYETMQNQKKVNITLFGGGFNFKIENEQKVNRYFYIIRDDAKQVFKIGKTNSALVNQSQNMRNKVIIYPFVYGVPIAFSPNEMMVINTNGYLQNINHFKKLFLTKVRLGPLNNQTNSLNSIGIIAQNKLDYNQHSPQIAMANKNTILSYLIASYNRINRFENKVAVYNRQNDVFMIEALGQTSTQHFDVIRVTPLNSYEMSEEAEETLNISFSSKKMILKQ